MFFVMGLAIAGKQGYTQPLVLEKKPVRIIQDPYPTFSGIAMVPEKGEVVISDDSRASLLSYTTEFTTTEGTLTEPLREIRGPKTHLGWNCGVAVSSWENGEIYTVDNDWKDNITVFPLNANGDVAPLREFTVDHGSWGIDLDRKRDELVVTTQHVNKVSFYPRTAQGDMPPKRFIQGPDTELADPHGVFVDSVNDEIFVTNHGNWRLTEPGEGYVIYRGEVFDGVRYRNTHKSTRPSSMKSRGLNPHPGKFLPPSITVYSSESQGNVEPVRVIQGSKTRLNLPMEITIDPASDQIAVANAGDDAILFFDRKAEGNEAPVRVIQGAATGLAAPTGLAIGSKWNEYELWVTNWDNHTATVYQRMAEGNVAPLRILYNAPIGAPSVGLGLAGDVAYDPKRDVFLVPN
jgi:6-phosphogluconolactonase (cycloisomerase 2 family)